MHIHDHNCQIGHGYTVIWTEFSGNRTQIHSCGFPTREDMERNREADLKRFDWTPPRWWQFWRWHDTVLF